MKKIVHLIILLLISFSSNFMLNAQNLTFDEHPIDLNYPGMSRISIFDLDKDGDLDIIGGSEFSTGIAWWRNDGGNPLNWTRFTIDASLVNIMSAEIAYINNDTLPDILTTSWVLNQIAWYENTGNPTANWTKHVIISSFMNAHDAEGLDMNQDGYTDVVATCSTPGSVMVCYNNGANPPVWSFQIVSGSFYGGKSVSIFDLDQDNDPDIIGAAATANSITWWENQQGNPISWNPHTITSNFLGCHDVDIVKMNSDTLYDIIGAGWLANEVSYWICNDLGNNLWTKTVVTNHLDTAVRAVGNDLDMDNDIDIVATGKITGELNIYENNNFSWTEINLKPNFYGGWALRVEDMDGDGDDDIVSGASTLGALYWWENKLINIGINKISSIVCDDYHLYQNYPNPFNPRTNIKFDLPKSGLVKLSVYNLLGKEIETLYDGELSAGSYEIDFNASSYTSGVYFYTLNSENFIDTKRMVLIK